MHIFDYESAFNVVSETFSLFMQSSCKSLLRFSGENNCALNIQKLSENSCFNLLFEQAFLAFEKIGGIMGVPGSNSTLLERENFSFQKNTAVAHVFHLFFGPIRE